MRASDKTSACKQLGDSQRTENKVNILRTGQLFMLSTIYTSDDCYMRLNNHNIIEISNNEGYLDMFI